MIIFRRRSDQPTHASGISALVRWLTLVLSLVVGVAPVIAYLAFSYIKTTTQMEGQLRLQALALSDFISDQPNTWDIAIDRILGHLDR